MLLKDVIGQEAIKAKIIGSVHQGRIPHAQLFLSNPGAGGLPLALAYAQYITCTNRTEVDSCGECNSCKKHQSFTHPDVHFSYPFVKDKGELSTDLISDWRAALKANPYMNYMDWMQFIGAEKKQGNIYSVFEIKSNISIGTEVLKEFIKMTGNIESGLAKYVGAGNDINHVYVQDVLSWHDKLKKTAQLKV